MNVKKIILLSALAVAGIVAFSHVAYAAAPTVSVEPSVGTENVGASFNVSVQLDPQGNQACVVEGTLNFNNAICRDITIASGLMAQTTPTCASPSFILGIPKCTTSLQNIITASVRGVSVGHAILSLTEVKVLGAGTVIASNANSGNYAIIAVPAPSPTPVVGAPAPAAQPAAAPAVTPTPAQNSIPNNAGAASLSSAMSNLLHSSILWWIVIVVILILLGLWAFDKFFSQKRKNQKQ